MAFKQDWSVGTRWQVGAGSSARRDEMRDGEVHRHLAMLNTDTWSSPEFWSDTYCGRSIVSAALATRSVALADH
jgi:hypothetical protein